jgi:hypothetical protein
MRTDDLGQYILKALSDKNGPEGIDKLQSMWTFWCLQEGTLILEAFREDPCPIR